jgi:hypothetical protein
MAQVTDTNLANQGFPSFRSELNNILGALNSNHIGSSRPSSAVAGTIWIDSSVANTYSLKIYDGTDDLELFTINTSTNAITLPSGIDVSYTETDPNSIPFAIALS